MYEQNIILNAEQAELLNHYQDFGFKSKSDLIRYAILLLKNKFDSENKLKKSAELYKLIYESDQELQDLTDSALLDLD